MSLADQERVIAETLSQARQAEAQRDLEVKKADYLQIVKKQQAQADKAYEIQTNIMQQQVRAEFGDKRYALLFKPGRYSFDARVGYYTQIAGLGLSPEDVVVNGHVQAVSNNPSRHVLTNFWRAAENLSITPPDGVDKWAVSQAAPYRRMHVRGALMLHDSGWSSGGFMSDSRVEGKVLAGSQQQWFTRNSEIQGWEGGHWNLVFLGTPGALPNLTRGADVSAAAAHGPIVTTIESTPPLP